MTKSNITGLLLRQMYPVLVNIIDIIADGENLDKEEIKKKYIPNDLKEYKKKRARAKGVRNGYSVFLADKEINDKISKENPTLKFGEKSKIKGKMWKELPDTEKEKYKIKAKELNSKNKKE